MYSLEITALVAERHFLMNQSNFFFSQLGIAAGESSEIVHALPSV